MLKTSMRASGLPTQPHRFEAAEMESSATNRHGVTKRPQTERQSPRLEPGARRSHPTNMLIGDQRPLVVRAAQGVAALLGPSAYPARPRRPKIVSHRGRAQTAPENTRAAFEAALAAGADGLELDLCVTKDDVVVLWHDADPNAKVAVYRQSGVDGARFVPRVPDVSSALRKPIAELTFSQVREHFGYVATSDENDECWPLERLEDIAAWLSAARVDPLVLDVKLRPVDLEQARPLAEELARLSCEHPTLLERAVHVFTPELEVFDALGDALRRHSQLDSLRLTADFELPGVVRTAQRIGARHVGIGATVRQFWAAVRREIADAIAAREAGVLETVTVWTVENPKALAHLHRLGVDAVLTDDVAGTRAVFDAIRARETPVRS
jgi:glycerophosphoryl diester phosphodiesterase